MSKVFFVEKREDSVVYGLIKDGRLIEIFGGRNGEDLLGNIFRGRVVDSDLNSDYVMVDIGLEHLGIMRKKDMLQNRNMGETVLVQVIREPYDDKGAKLSEFFRIGGKYLLLTPYEKRVIFPINAELIEKKSDYYSICSDGIGYRLRSAGTKAALQEIHGEYAKLLEKFVAIEREKNYLPTPKLVEAEEDLVLKYFRDFSEPFFSSNLIVNDLFYYRELKKCFGENGNIFLRQGWSIDRDPIILKGIAEMRTRKVNVLSGANLVFDRTEAMNIIDVNSGSFSKRGIKNSISFQVNDSVLEELVRQIRLRDLGGIIIVDFLEMTDVEKMSIKDRLICLLKEDPRTSVYDFTTLGLLELTRKRYGKNGRDMEFFLSSRS